MRHEQVNFRLSPSMARLIRLIAKLEDRPLAAVARTMILGHARDVIRAAAHAGQVDIGEMTGAAQASSACSDHDDLAELFSELIEASIRERNERRLGLATKN